MKKYFLILCLLTQQGHAAEDGKHPQMPPPPLLSPRPPAEMDLFRWPEYICRGQNPVSQIRLKFIWNPLQESISAHFRQEFPLSKTEPVIEWQVSDISVGSWNSNSEKNDFILSYEGPNARDCSYQLHFKKTIPGFLKSEVQLSLDCDGAESSLTLDCEYR